MGALFAERMALIFRNRSEHTFAVGAFGATVQSTWSGKDVYIDGIISGSTTIALAHGATAGQAAVIHITNAANTFSRNGKRQQRGERSYLESRRSERSSIRYRRPKSGICAGTLLINTIGTTTIAGLTGTAGTVKPNTTAGTYTLNVNNAGNVSFGGTLINNTGILALTKTGAGTLTLSGANSYTGLTTVNAGTLAYGASNVN